MSSAGRAESSSQATSSHGTSSPGAGTGPEALLQPARPLLIRRAGVLGAGTMGARIAAHLANAGIPVLLLDLPAKSESADPLAKSALAALRTAKPAAFYEPSLAAMVTPGDFDHDLAA